MPVTAAAVALAAAQAVSFAAKDGWTVSAVYRPAREGRATVILAHGVGSAGGEWARLTEALAARGVGSLALDLRGHAGSRNGPPGSTDYEGFDARDWASAAEDLRAAAAWLESRGVPAGRVAFGGASIGANLASVVASERPSAPFLLLLSPGASYRGVPLRVRKGLKTLAAASPGDDYAYAAVRSLAAEKLAVALTASRGHGAQMFEDRKSFERLVDWIARASR